MALSVRRVFADGIELSCGHVGSGGPSPSGWCPCQGANPATDTGTRPCDNRGRDESGVSRAKGPQWPVTPEAGDRHGRRPFTAPGGPRSADSLALDAWPPGGERHVPACDTPAGGDLFQQRQTCLPKRRSLCPPRSLSRLRPDTWIGIFPNPHPLGALREGGWREPDGGSSGRAGPPGPRETRIWASGRSVLCP